MNGIGYALDRLGELPDVYSYLDISHFGWLGWADVSGPTVERLYQAANASGETVAEGTG